MFRYPNRHRTFAEWRFFLVFPKHRTPFITTVGGTQKPSVLVWFGPRPRLCPECQWLCWKSPRSLAPDRFFDVAKAVGFFTQKKNMEKQSGTTGHGCLGHKGRVFGSTTPWIFRGGSQKSIIWKFYQTLSFLFWISWPEWGSKSFRSTYSTPEIPPMSTRLLQRGDSLTTIDLYMFLGTGASTFKESCENRFAPRIGGSQNGDGIICDPQHKT